MAAYTDRWTKRTSKFLLFVLLGGTKSLTPLRVDSATWGGDAGFIRYSPLDQINKDNVKRRIG